MKLATFLPWALLALVLAVPLFAQGNSPFRLIHASLVKSVPIDVRVPGQPQAKDIVRIVEGTPFTVPANKTLVMTALGTSSSTSQTAFLVCLDGVPIWHAANQSPPQKALAIHWPGIVAQAGSVVTLSHDGTRGVILGYLEDAK